MSGDAAAPAVAPPKKGPGRGQAARGVEMRRKILELRVAGVTFEAIGRQLGVSKQVAHRHYQRAIAEARSKTEDLATEAKELTRRRLDGVVAAHWMNKAHPRSGEVIIRAEALRMKLEGTEAPSKHELAGKDGGPIQHEHRTMPLENLSDGDLAKLKEIAQRAAAAAAPGAPGDVRPPITA